MTVSKTSKAKRPANSRVSAASPAATESLADPKARFRAVMRQAAAARAASEKPCKAAKTETATKTSPAKIASKKTKSARRDRRVEAIKPKVSKASARRAPVETRSKPSPAASPSGRLPKADAAAACYRSSAAFVEGLQTSGALWGEFAKSHFDRGVEAAYALVTAKSMREMMDVHRAVPESLNLG
ncbi:MAG: phasin family protein [Proteobacteria bacterium]|nr:phasin family protein [Pseudomonadota bacterium]